MYVKVTVREDLVVLMQVLAKNDAFDSLSCIRKRG